MPTALLLASSNKCTPAKGGRVRCVSFTTTRQRCTRWTSRSDKCNQHLELEDGLRVAPSRLTDAGWGLFTTVARRKGQHITQYAGARVRVDPSSPEGRSYGGVYVLQLSPTEFIDACHPCCSAGRYSNTARAWNVAQGECRGNNAHFTLDRRGGGTAWITATRTVNAGEEVLTAYGRQYHIPHTKNTVVPPPHR